MRTIALAKRPSSNTVLEMVLEDGVGAICVDAVRLPTEDNLGRKGVRVSSLVGDERTGRSLGRFNPGIPYGIDTHPLGRYPTNLIQSNDLLSPKKFFYQILGDTMSKYDGIPDDLVDYLHKMITPTHVGGETLMAMDLDAVDWASIPDGKYHGLMAVGEPTQEQVEHMWRVVKPGAYVALFAPEHNPVGHVGASTLENNGFEIRDSILWVQDASKIHYIPKAAKKERHAGCEALAQLRKGEPMYELRGEALEDDDALSQLAFALGQAGMSEEKIDALSETGLPKSKIPPDFMYLFKKVKGADTYGNFHPCVKPKDVMIRLLADVPKDAKVLDTFLGSGSTALACVQTGHDFVGMELDPEYAQIAEARIRHHDQNYQGWNQTVIVSEAEPVNQVAADMSEGLLDLFS